MSLKQNNDWYEARNQWLEEQGRTEGDVMYEEQHGEYIMKEVGEYNEMQRIYLPSNLQKE